MDKNLLKVDLDIEKYEDALNLITERLAYFHDIGFLNIDTFERIELIHKTKFSCRIKLSKEFQELWIVLLQTLLGSDYRKEVNTLINHYKFSMKYSNRLFTVKRYKEGEIKFAQIFDITSCVIPYIKSGERIQNAN